MTGLDDIEWDVTRPHSTAFMGAHGAPVPRSVWKSKIPGIRPGDQIALISESGEPVFKSSIVGGNSVLALFESIERGMNTPLPESLISYTYCRIGRFGKPDRKTFVKLAESGKLCPRHLVGDHCFFEGHLTLTVGRVWTYSTGS